MQKYRLLQDLFYAKKGDIIFIPKNPPENYGLRPMYSFSENSEKGKFVWIIHKDDISKWLEEIPEKPKNIWDLKEGDKYFYLSEAWDIRIAEHIWHILDDERIEIGNAFLKKDEALKELKKRIAIAKIKKYCWENGIDTHYNSETANSYWFNLNALWKIISFDDYRNWSPFGYFSHENAQKILENFEEELKIILE